MNATGTDSSPLPRRFRPPHWRPGDAVVLALAVATAGVAFGVGCTHPGDRGEVRAPSERRIARRAGEDAREPIALGGERPTPAEARARQHAQTSLDDPAFEELSVVNGEPYADMYFKHYGVNPTIDTDEEPVSTFATDVDTASYSLARAYLRGGNLPNEAAIRVEEFVNAFDYGYEAPASETFALQVEAFPSPHRRGYHVLHVGLKGRDVAAAARDPVDLVLVVDVSGSMREGNRLALLQRSIETLVEGLSERDTVGIVAFNERSREVLPPTAVDGPGARRILSAVASLGPDGNTSVSAGVSHGYRMLGASGREGARSRVILFSDGVANSGLSSADGIFDRVASAHGRGIPLTGIGVGLGNYNDVLLERLAQRGGGSYHYMDDLGEARRVFRTDLVGILQPIARDAKVQVAFDPGAVARYRLLGFENRRLETEDFEDDDVDGGGIGAGHTVTALYEVRFQGSATPDVAAERGGGGFATLRVRYHPAEGGAPRIIEREVPFSVVRDRIEAASAPARLSLVSASFAEKLRGSYWVRGLSYDDVLRHWEALPQELRARGDVRELRDLIVRANRLDDRHDRFADSVPEDEMSFDRVPVLQ